MSSFPMPHVAWRDPTHRAAAMASEAPRRPWHRFITHDFQPKPGEHVAIIGPTGQGKTVLQNNILPHFQFVAVLATKPQDDSMESLIKRGGYIKLERWRNLNPIDFPRRVVWPNAKTLGAVPHQREVFSDALERIFREGGQPLQRPVGWAVAIDELWYIINVLGLDMQIKVFLLQSRSLGHSLIVATQRPVSVPLEVYDQSTHLFFFRDNDYRNLQRLSEINVANRQLVQHTVASLERHQVLYINTRTGRMVRTHAPNPQA